MQSTTVRHDGATDGSVVAAGRAFTRRVIPLVWVLGVLVTVLAWGIDEASSAWYAPEAHLVVDTVDGLIAGVVCGLLVARARTSRRVGDRLLAEAFGLLALASLGLSVVGELVAPGAEMPIWVQAAMRNGAVVLLLVAVLVDRRTGRTPWRPWPAALVLVASVWVALSSGSERTAVLVVTDDGRLLGLESSPLLTAALALGTVVAMATAVILCLRQRHGERLLGGWLAPALVVMAFARLHYLLFPSVYTSYVFSGDALRTLGYLVLLVGAVGEIVRHWSDESRSAVVAERHRLARELHDGAIQEMTLARLDAVTVAKRADDPALDDIVRSLELALGQVRSTMDDLVGFEDGLDVVVTRVAEATAVRLGLDVDVEAGWVSATSSDKHELARILREAISNAARHGAASRVVVSLGQRGGQHVLRVVDDGRGFDPDAPRTGFGLVSMRERAARLGGRLVLAPSSAGTTVEVVW